MEDNIEIVEMTQVSMKISVENKRKLQSVATYYCDGNITRLVELLAIGKLKSTQVKKLEERNNNNCLGAHGDMRKLLERVENKVDKLCTK